MFVVTLLSRQVMGCRQFRDQTITQTSQRQLLLSGDTSTKCKYRNCRPFLAATFSELFFFMLSISGSREFYLKSTRTRIKITGATFNLLDSQGESVAFVLFCSRLLFYNAIFATGVAHGRETYVAHNSPCTRKTVDEKICLSKFYWLNQQECKHCKKKKN